MAVQDFVQLQNVISGNGDCIKAFMDNSQNISVSGYFLFITIFRSSFFFDKLSDAGTGGYYSFYGI